MNIDLERHIKTVTDEVRHAVRRIEELQMRHLRDDPFSKVLNQAIEWYETGGSHGSTDLYCFFKSVNSNPKDPAGFYNSLRSFLVNTCLDDSYFLIKWEKFSSEDGGWVEGTPYIDKPYVIMTVDHEGASCRAEDLLKIMEFYIKQRDEDIKQRDEDIARIEEFEAEWEAMQNGE